MKRKVLLLTLTIVLLNIPATSQTIPSPEQMFGFKMGSDKKLIDWDQILSYFQMLNNNSKRVQVVELGQTTLGRPMIMAIIGAKETMANLQKYQSIQQQLARPFDLDAFKAEALVRTGKLVFLITMNIHSTEIASSQESVELAYELATANSVRVGKILDNVLILLIPSLNPDGQDMVTEWYLKDVGTEYEGSRMPMKYHHYADHDNNRDWHFFNLVESRNVAKVLYHDWYPEIIMDQHQMGSRGARLFLPPYADPVNPNVAPALMASVNMLGKYVVSDLHDQGFQGVVTGTIFNAFFEGTMSKTPLWHNRIGILTEAASTRVASPIFFPKTSLRGMGIDLPDYSQQTNFLDPWDGGWWRLRDIIEMEKAATYAMLDLAATYKKKFKTNFYRLNREAIAAGRAGHPFAYVMPTDQHDPGNVIEMLRRLRIANIDIYRAEEDFRTGAGEFRKGAFIIPLAQAARAYIKDLMERQEYPNLSEYPGGPPRQPYDVTAWTFPLQFGITAIPVAQPFGVEMTSVMEPRLEFANAPTDSDWLTIDRRFNLSFAFVNELLQSNKNVFQLENINPELPAGTFLVQVRGKDAAVVADALTKYPVERKALADTAGLKLKKVQLARVAIYQPWQPWVYDEGWLRLVLDNFGFEYTGLKNADFKSRAKFKRQFDVLIFGSQGKSWIIDGKPEDAKEPALGEPKVRKEYTGGIGKAGVQKVSDFLQEGGTVLFFGEACNFAIDELRLPAVNTLKGSKREQYFAPGSIFEMHLDPTSRLAYGLQDLVSIYKNQPVALNLKAYNREIVETGYFGSGNVLQSGWIVGENRLRNMVALAEIPVGDGMAILYAFRPQHRGQTFGTFKLIFNALYE